MARGAPRALPDHDADDDETPEDRQPNATKPPDWAAHVRDLQSGERIYVYRTAPIVAKGYLGILTLPSERFEDLLELIKQTWGGGTFRIQRYTPSGDFARGGATIDISGPPIVDGEPIYPGGSRRPNPAPATPAPVVVQAPPIAGDTTGVVQALAGLVQSLSSQAGHHTPDASAGLDGLVKLAQHLTGVRPADPFEQFERFVKMYKLMQGGGSRRRDEDDDDDDPAEGIGTIGSVIKMMERGMSGAQSITPRPTAPTAIWNGTTWVYHGPQPPPSAPPPGPPPSVATQAPLPPTQTPTPTSDASDDDDEWEEVPITAEDVAEHVKGLDDAAARQFLADVMARLGVEIPG